MIGFLGVSFGPAASVSDAAAAEIVGLAGVVAGPVRRSWGAPRAGSTLLSTWEREDGLITDWDATDQGARFSTGLFRDGPALATPETLIGTGTVVDIDRQSVSAWTDDRGYRSLFVWQGPGVAAVSTRTETLAALADLLGAPCSKDPSVAAEMALVGWLGAHRTGWREISALQTGESVSLRAGRLSLETDHTGADWVAIETDESPSALLDRMAAELVANTRTVLELGLPTVADLTSGRDTRLLLGAATVLGGEHDLAFQTTGDRGLEDVEVALALAKRAGLDHSFGFQYQIPTDPLATRFSEHVRNSYGLINPMHGFRTVFPPVHEVRIQGQMGELVRGHQLRRPRTNDKPVDVDRLAHWFGAGCVDLLRPDAELEGRERFRHDVLRGGGARLPMWFADLRYYGDIRLRGRLSRVEDFTPEFRVYPMYTRQLLRDANAVLWKGREVVIGDELMARIAPQLDEELPPVDAPATAAPETAPTIWQEIVRQQLSERQALLADMIDVDSEAWEWIDRDRYRAAVDDFAAMKHSQSHLIHGAAGAIAWLAT